MRAQKQPSNKHLSDVCHPPSKRQILTFQCGTAGAKRGPVSEFGGTFKTRKSVTYMPCSLRSHLPLPSLSPPHPGQPEPEVAQLLRRVQLFATPWTIAYQASPSLGFFRQEYWSGLPFPSPGDLPDPGIEPRSPAL